MYVNNKLYVYLFNSSILLINKPINILYIIKLVTEALKAI